MRAGIAAALIIGVIGVAPAAAMRLRFDVRYGEQKIDGAEICVFPSPGVGEDDPVPKYFASDDVRCLPADRVLAFPAGKWSYVTRVGERYVSYGASMDIVRGAAEAGYKEIGVEVVDAVQVDFANVIASIPNGQFLVVYFPSTRLRLATSAPLPRGSTSMTIPLGVPWIPLLSDGTSVTRVGRLHRSTTQPEVVGAGELAPRDGVVDVVAWFRWNQDGRDYAINNPPPTLRLMSGGIEQQAIAGVGSSYSDGLVIFKNVPRTAARLSVGGELWEPSERALAAPAAGAQTVMVPALPANPAGAVELQLSFDRRLLGSNPNARTCDRNDLAKAAESLVSIELSRCAQLLPDMTPGELQQLGGCEAASVHSIDPEAAAKAIMFPGLSAGRYRIAITLPRLPPKYTSVHVAAGRRTELPFELRYADIYGHVTRGGKPLAARLLFAGGSAVSDRQTGEYAAVLSASPERRLVTVTPCAGSWRYVLLPESPVVAGAVFDVDVPDDRIDVTVANASTGSAIVDAKTSAVANIGSEEAPVTVRTANVATGEDGRATLEPLPVDRDLQICARHDDYRERCVDVPKLDGGEHREVRLELQRIAKLDGKVSSPFSVHNLLLMWVTPDGRVTEVDAVHDDGSFRYGTAHAAPEHVVLVSASHPLTALPIPAREDGLKIAVPSGPLRAIRITLSPRTPAANALVGLRIGGMPIPYEAFSRHQVMRGLDQEVRNRGPLVVPDVLATDVVTVQRGPDPDQLPRGVNTIEDACMRPEYRPLCSSLLVGAEGGVTFP